MVPFRVICRAALLATIEAQKEHDEAVSTEISFAIYDLVGQIAANARHGHASREEVSAVLEEELAKLKRGAEPEPHSGTAGDAPREPDTIAEPSESRLDRAWNLAIGGDSDGAMALMKKEEQECRKQGDLKGLASALGTQAVILSLNGDHEGAIRLHREEERICREIGDLEGLQASVGNRVMVHRRLGDLDEAAWLLVEQERICRTIGNVDGIATALDNRALVQPDRVDLEGARALLKEQVQVCRETDQIDFLL